MSISSNVLSIGSPASQVHAPSVHEQRITLRNLQPVSDADEYARDGYVFIADARFTLANSASTAFAITTGSYGAQFQFYKIDAESDTVLAQLIEGATFTSGGTVQAYNLNRTVADDYDAVLTGATNVTGGTVVSEEYTPGSNQSGSSLSVSKVQTLEPSTAYVMKFTDVGGNGTEVHFQLAWSEQYNGGHDVWVGYGTADVDAGFRLKPQESIQFEVSPLDSLVAFSSQPTRLNVMRQVVE